MRILVIMYIGSPWSRNFISELIKLGHQVYIVDIEIENTFSYLRRDDKFQEESINEFLSLSDGFTALKQKKKYHFFKSVVQIRKIFKEFKGDAILSLYGGVFATIGCLTRIKPFFVYIVGSDILLSSFLKTIVTKFVLKSADIVFSNGLALGKKAQAILPSANIVNIYLGTDTNIFKPAKRKNDLLRIICTRGFEEVYNNIYLIDGLSYLSFEDLPEFEVVFTSQGYLLDEIKTYADTKLSEQMKNHVKFLNGVGSDCLLSNLQNSHIYVSLSKSDGASISLMEALSCGLFPILSDIPANQEWISGENGILVPLQEPRVLANALIKAIKDESWRNKAGTINRILVKDLAESKENILKFEKELLKYFPFKRIKNAN